MDAIGRRPHWSLLGVALSSEPLDAIAAACLTPRAGASDPVTVACANLHCLVVANHDQEFASALRTATFVTTDGAPLRVAGRMRGEVVGPRITGSDVFAAVMQRLNSSNGRAMFLGSTTSVLARIGERVTRDYPQVGIATFAPPFGTPSTADDRAAVEAVNAFAPDVLWIGMSAPKQEKWMARYRTSLDAGAVVCVGAVFDFYAGSVRRAPSWMRRAGLEWLHRLACEPRRLWRRYLISGPVFISLVIRDSWSRTPGVVARLARRASSASR